MDPSKLGSSQQLLELTWVRMHGKVDDYFRRDMGKSQSWDGGEN